MGLDNGIRVHMKDKDAKIHCKSVFVEARSYIDCTYDIWTNALLDEDEVAYWRKCWNIRSDIFDILKTKENDVYYYDVSYDQLLQIIALLKSYNRFNWNKTDEYSIWEWKEIKPHLRRQIKTLKHVAAAMREHPDAFTLQFYDSY